MSIEAMLDRLLEAVYEFESDVKDDEDNARGALGDLLRVADEIDYQLQHHRLKADAQPNATTTTEREPT